MGHFEFKSFLDTLLTPPLVQDLCTRLELHLQQPVKGK